MKKSQDNSHQTISYAEITL